MSTFVVLILNIVYMDFVKLSMPGSLLTAYHMSNLHEVRYRHLSGMAMRRYRIYVQTIW
jgi:hypothetical protein